MGETISLGYPELCKSGEHELSTSEQESRHACIHFLATDVVGPTVSGSCPNFFKMTVNQINPFSLSLKVFFIPRYSVTAKEIKVRHVSQTEFTDIFLHIALDNDRKYV